MSEHRCHARGCAIAIPPAKLMCGSHWRRVPIRLQRLLLLHYRPGQEAEKNPSREYLETVRQAIDAVAQTDGG